MKVNNRVGMPTKKQIVKYWAEILIYDYNKYSMDIYYDDFYSNTNEVTNTCFACGCWAGTERCHIIPLCNGGTNNISNLHLLCKECHFESEYFETKESYFNWFKYKDSHNSGSFLRLLNKAKILTTNYENKQYDLIPEYLLTLLDESNTKCR